VGCECLERPEVGEVEEGASPSLLLRNWPAFPERSTRAVRDSFFASPQLPRLLKPDSLKGTIVRGARLLNSLSESPGNRDMSRFRFNARLPYRWF
jgi:hypothetical protein